MKITPMTNAKGEIDYGHAWRYFQMGFTDEYGNSHEGQGVEVFEQRGKEGTV